MDKETAMADIAALKQRQAEIQEQMAAIEAKSRKELAERVVAFLDSEGFSVADTIVGLRERMDAGKPKRRWSRRPKAAVADVAVAV